MTYFVILWQISGSDPKGNVIPAIIGGAALISAAINVGTYVATNVGRLGSDDFNLGSGYTLSLEAVNQRCSLKWNYLKKFTKLTCSTCKPPVSVNLPSAGFWYSVRHPWMAASIFTCLSLEFLRKFLNMDWS